MLLVRPLNGGLNRKIHVQTHNCRDPEPNWDVDLIQMCCVNTERGKGNRGERNHGNRGASQDWTHEPGFPATYCYM
ncbi:hypothetical protein XENTR_v10020089 [Xenopus tropicalis]|nr:hypothetical protein XENTR_v10020089 [Xenopus tropicalis]